MRNLVIVRRIFLTLSISFATSERSFSKLKLIRNYIRSTISQNRLVGLATLWTKHDIAEFIDINAIILFSQVTSAKNGVRLVIRYILSYRYIRM